MPNELDDWKAVRLKELGRGGQVTVKQIAERLGLQPDYVSRVLRRNGIVPKRDRPFNYGAWLMRQYEKDRLAGKKTGRRPSFNGR